MVLVLEGLAALGAFELAVAGRLVEQLVLREKQRDVRRSEGEGSPTHRVCLRDRRGAPWILLPPHAGSGAITHRITHLLISWRRRRRRPAFRIWQQRK